MDTPTRRYIKNKEKLIICSTPKTNRYCLTILTSRYLNMYGYYYDPDTEQMIQAQKSARAKKDGFQGCVDYGKGCDFDGFYGAEYSPEGYCGDCEVKFFPARYHGCCFCGKAIQHGKACWECETGFSQWLIDLFYNKNKKSKSTIHMIVASSPNETGNSILWDSVRWGVNTLIKELYRTSEPRILEQTSLSFTNRWPGFYMGNDKWYNPDPYDMKNKIDISDITLSTGAIVLKRELEKNGIYIDREIQYQSKTSE